MNINFSIRIRVFAMAIFHAVIVFFLPAQTQMEWVNLENSPPQTGRYEDLCFIDNLRGWAVSGNSTVIQTLDGGESWQKFSQTGTYKIYFRTVVFIDSTNGIIGTLNQTNPIIRTEDGGKTFFPAQYQGVKPKKICGVFLRDGVLFGVGAYDGTPTFVRSGDGGKTWTGKAMLDVAVSLVDCHFFDTLNGLAVGSFGGTKFSDGNSIVIKTTDGGETWTQVYRSARTKEWGWKIFFLNDSVGYVSIEAAGGNIFYLKTTDKGKSWNEKYFADNFDVEGIGFVNESTGWIGGWTGPTYQTTDSGATWKTFYLSDSLRNLNRIRKLNDTLMYAAGTRIFKYQPKKPTSVIERKQFLPEQLTLLQNYPNPFNPQTVIEFEIFEYSSIHLAIYNVLGQLVETVMDNPKPPGRYRMKWQPSHDVAGGIYFYQIKTERATVTKSMLYIK